MERESRLDKITKKWAVVVGFFSISVFFLFAVRDRDEEGLAAAVCIVAILFAAQAFWDLRRSIWFWVAMILVVIIHIPIVFLVPWPTSRTHRGSGLMVIFLPDFFLIYGLFKLVERMTTKTGSGI